MKNIVCYGDSNTWGWNPEKGGERHLYNDRWTTILQSLLGNEYNIIPEGLNGRTSVWDDPIKGFVNGKDTLLPILHSHKPIDLVILFLGTNDLKQRLNLPPSDIALGVGTLVDIIKKSETGINNSSPKIIVVIPPEVRKLSNFKDQFGDCIETSKRVPEFFKNMGEEKRVETIEIGKHVRFSDLDGIHFEKSQLPIVANILYESIKNKFK